MKSFFVEPIKGCLPILCIFLFSICLLPTEAAAEEDAPKAQLKISGDALENPTPKAKAVFSVTKGEVVSTGEKRGKWIRIINEKGLRGWAPTASLTFMPPKPTEKAAETIKAGGDESAKDEQKAEEKSKAEEKAVSPKAVEEVREPKNLYAALNKFSIYSEPFDEDEVITESEAVEDETSEPIGEGDFIEELGVVKQGNKVAILAEEKGWYKIRVKDGLEGWCQKSEAKLLEFKEVFSDFIPAEREVHFYFAPSRESLKKILIPKGFELKVVAENDEWQLLATRDGSEGWAPKKDRVELVEEKPSAAERQEKSAEIRPIKIGLFKLEASNVEQSAADIVYESLITELQKLVEVSVIGKKEIYMILDIEAEKQLMSCSDDSCMVEIAGALNVDYVVAAALSKVENTHSFTVKLIAMENMKVEKQFNKHTKGSMEEAFLEQVGEAVKTIFPDRPLIAGKERGVSSEVMASFNRPPLNSALFYTSLGLTIATGAAGAAALFISKQKHRDFKDLSAKSLKQPVDAGEINMAKTTGEKMQMAGNILIISAGALALTSALLSIWTDWKGAPDPENEAAEGGGEKKARLDYKTLYKPQLVLTEGGGLALSIEGKF